MFLFCFLAANSFKFLLEKSFPRSKQAVPTCICTCFTHFNKVKFNLQKRSPRFFSFAKQTCALLVWMFKTALHVPTVLWIEDNQVWRVRFSKSWASSPTVHLLYDHNGNLLILILWHRYIFAHIRNIGRGRTFGFCMCFTLIRRYDRRWVLSLVWSSGLFQSELIHWHAHRRCGSSTIAAPKKLSFPDLFKVFSVVENRPFWVSPWFRLLKA